jgi:RNA polymerase-binding transcription factor DksA
MEVEMDTRRLFHFKQLILNRICDVLEQDYDVSPEDIMLANDDVPARPIRKPGLIIDEAAIDYALAFKGGTELVELQSALHRIKSGEYGKCIVCKGSIPTKELEQVLTKRVCNRCAAEVSHEGYTVLIPTMPDMW